MSQRRKEVVALAWNGLVHNLRRMERTTLELMRHPEATDKDVMAAANSYRDAHRRMRETEHKVQTFTGSHFLLAKLTPNKDSK